ncbi:PQQ-dependent sugar dehydrogenase [Kitasatospora sp. NPDC054939]
MHRRLATALLALLLGPVTAVGCSSAAPPAATSPPSAPAPSAAASGAPTGSAAPAPSAPAQGAVTVRTTVTDGLDSPWGLVVLPDGDLLVSSRDKATITRVATATGAKTEAGSVPDSEAGSEGGLLGLALSPAYATDHQVYAYYSTDDDNRIVRFGYDPARPTGAQLSEPVTVLTGIPKGSRHNGGRIAFGPDGLLYAGTGDAGRTALAQDRSSLAGKILRLAPDGAPAPGNPVPGSPVYSLGHRNVQGLAWDDLGQLWASEFGADGYDELNLIKPGANYGWPEVEGVGNRPEFTDPVTVWRTADASPSGIAYAHGAIWLAALRGTRLWRVPIAGEGLAGQPEALLSGTYGRLRTVVADRDGTLLLATNNTDRRGDPRPGDDRILRLEVAATGG